MKIRGAIKLWSARFHHGQAPVFNASIYLDFLHRVALHYRRRGAILISPVNRLKRLRKNRRHCHSKDPQAVLSRAKEESRIAYGF